MKKRLLATALLLCMIFTLFPMSAFAEADVEEAVPEEITLDEASDQASSVEDPVPGDAVIEETLEDGDFVDDIDVEGIIAEETSSEDAFTEETAEDAVIAEPATDDTEEMLMESSSTPTVLMSADQVEDTTISSVSVTISEPVKGFSPDLSPSVPEGAHYSVIGVKWFEENMDPISSPETYAFQYPGKVIVTLVLKADSGYEFAHNATPAAVNGSYDTYDYNYASGDSFLMFSYEFTIAESYQGKPVFSQEPVNQTVATGKFAQFECTLEKYTRDTTITWEYKTGSSSSWTTYKTVSVNIDPHGANIYSDSIYFTATEEMNGYQYRVTASNSYGSVTSSSVTLSVTGSTTLPQIPATAPEDKSVKVGDTAYFSFSFTNYDSATTITWYYRKPKGSWAECKAPTFSFGNMPGMGLAGVNFKVQKSMDGYQFYCKVTNSAGYSDTRIATLTIPVISDVDIFISAPAVGSKPSYISVLPSDAKYYVRNYTSGYYKNDVIWYDNTAHAFLTPDHDFFQIGHEYDVRINLLAKEGYVFSDTPNGTINGNTITEFTNYPSGMVDTAGIPVGAFEYTFPTLLFSDVADSSAYYFKAVYWAAGQGITSGTSATTFSPGKECTRGQIVTFLWKAMGSPEPSSMSNPFTDVKSSDYFYKAVLWAKGKGITSGTTATTFSPGKPCTRGQIVTFLWKAMGSPEPSSTSNLFVDVKPSDYFYKPVLWAKEKGITSGTTATTFSPGKTCTRAQAMTFLWNAKGKPSA